MSQSQKGLKILQICSKPPIPAVDGGCIAMLAATKALLRAGHKVKLLSIETQKHPYSFREEESELINKTDFEAVFIDTSVSTLGALKSLINQESYNISRFYSDEFAKKLKDVLKNHHFDIVQLESLFASPYISLIRQTSPGSKIVLRSHNVENEIWFQKSNNAKNFLSALYLKHLAKKLKQYEDITLKKVDAVAAISENDAHYFKKINAKILVETIQTAMEEGNENHTPLLADTFFFIGSFDWQPNADGINWLLKEVWPNVVNKFPHLKFRIAGRKMPQSLMKQTIPGVDFLGEIEDASDFIKSNGIMLVPLFSGSGIRIKILEAMAKGKAVISTSLGAEGIGAEDKHTILLANTAEDFIKSICKCVENANLSKELGKNARIFVKENYSVDGISRKFDSLYNRIISQ
jgi:polysaccharide biosynthesis protein PslH